MRHRPFKELADEVKRDPESRMRIEAMKQAMEDGLKLSRLRDEVGLTQQELASILNVSQANVSRIEHEEDVYLSTLRAYVAALGGELEINAVFPDGKITLVAANQEPVPARS
jgi:transcriptional regulator with XRE-family HTH domain